MRAYSISNKPVEHGAEEQSIEEDEWQLNQARRRQERTPVVHARGTLTVVQPSLFKDGRQRAKRRHSAENPAMINDIDH